MQLFVTERHRFGALLAQKLGCSPFDEVDGARRWTGDGKGVISLGGAIARLAPPEAYNAELSDWARLDLLPIFPEEFLLKIEREDAAELLRQSCGKATLVVVATDPSREGEAVGMTALGLTGWRGPTFRMWRTDNSSRSVEAALNSLRPIEESASYAQAAAIRAEGDWVEGMNCSRIIAGRIKWRTPDGRPAQAPKSGIGRVQGTAFSAIAAADQARSAWRPIKAHGFQTTFRTSGGVLKMIHIGVAPIVDRAEAERERMRLAKAGDVIIALTNSRAAVPPPPPFDEPLLQFTMHAAATWSMDRTTKVLSMLYEAGLVTNRNAEVRRYGPRTASEAEAIVTSLKAAGRWPSGATGGLRNDCIADKLGTIGHGAIAPTGDLSGLEGLPADGREDAELLFKTIIDRFAVSHMADGVDSVARAECIDDQLRTHRAFTRRVKEQGWRSLSDEQTVRIWVDAAADADARPRQERIDAPWPEFEGVSEYAALTGEVPDIETARYQGRPVDAETLVVSSSQPPRLTPLTLRSLLEDASSAMRPEGAASLPPGPHPIGAASTRADVIDKLIERDVIFIDGDGSLRMSSAGVSLYEFLTTYCPELLDVSQAAAFEHVIRAVENRQMSAAEGRKAIQARNLRIIRALLAAPEFIGEVIEKKPKAEPHQGTWVPNGARRESARATSPGSSARGFATKNGEQLPSGRDNSARRTDGPRRVSSAAGRSSSTPPPSNAVWLTVPFEKRDEAKSLGARWSDDKKKWWVDPSTADYRMLRQKKFLPR